MICNCRYCNGDVDLEMSEMIEGRKRGKESIKTASIEDLKQNPHVQGLLETLKEIEKSRYSPIGDDGDFQTPDAEIARAKLSEWGL